MPWQELLAALEKDFNDYARLGDYPTANFKRRREDFVKKISAFSIPEIKKGMVAWFEEAR